MFWRIKIIIVDLLLNFTVRFSTRLFCFICDIFKKEVEFLISEREKEIEDVVLPDWMLTEEYKKQQLERLHQKMKWFVFL